MKKKKLHLYFLYLLPILWMSCKASWQAGNFSTQINNLKVLDDLILLKNKKSIIAVSASSQGRVFLSSLDGMNSEPIGWYNKNRFNEGFHYDSMVNLAGESRLWFAPQGGPFSLFHEPGIDQSTGASIPSSDFNNRRFEMINQTKNAVTVRGFMNLRNTYGANFNIEVNRKLSLLSQKEIETDLEISIDSLKYVAYKAETKATNIGDAQWKKESGLIAIWEISCVSPSKENWVIIPHVKNLDSITYYTSEIDNERIVLHDSTLFFKADANYISKIGLKPNLGSNIMGSYDVIKNRLSIVTFSADTTKPYVTSSFVRDNPYDGDAINIFNGDILPEYNLELPFFEFESISSTSELKPNESIHHVQTIYHFKGSFKYLNNIAQKALGVSLNNLPQ